MESRKINKFTYFLRLEKGEEIISLLKKFSEEKKLKGAFFYAIGAGKNFIIGYYDLAEKRYLKKEIKEECEILSLIGNISHSEKEIFIHSHIVISNQNFNLLGGHLFSGEVTATLEVFLFLTEERIERKFFSDIGLNLISFKRVKRSS